MRTAHAEGATPDDIASAFGLTAELVASALGQSVAEGNGMPLLGEELLAETHRLVLLAEAAVARAPARDRCSVCGSEKVVTHTTAGVTYYCCGHSEVLP